MSLPLQPVHFSIDVLDMTVLLKTSDSLTRIAAVHNKDVITKLRIIATVDLVTTGDTVLQIEYTYWVE
jgi:hypothetical protein